MVLRDEATRAHANARSLQKARDVKKNKVKSKCYQCNVHALKERERKKKS